MTDRAEPSMTSIGSSGTGGFLLLISGRGHDFVFLLIHSPVYPYPCPLSITRGRFRILNLIEAATPTSSCLLIVPQVS